MIQSKRLGGASSGGLCVQVAGVEEKLQSVRWRNCTSKLDHMMLDLLYDPFQDPGTRYISHTICGFGADLEVGRTGSRKSGETALWKDSREQSGTVWTVETSCLPATHRNRTKPDMVSLVQIVDKGALLTCSKHR